MLRASGFERTRIAVRQMSWARINGATQIAIAEELKQFGIDVFPQFAEIAMEEFLDTGAVSQAFTLPRSSAFEQEPPFAYSSLNCHHSKVSHDKQNIILGFRWQVQL
jgi:hypothetical protein